MRTLEFPKCKCCGGSLNLYGLSKKKLKLRAVEIFTIREEKDEILTIYNVLIVDIKKWLMIALPNRGINKEKCL